jgi:serine protease Do
MTYSTFHRKSKRRYVDAFSRHATAMALVAAAAAGVSADDGVAARARRRTPVVEVVEQCRTAVVNISTTRRFLIQRGIGPFDILLGERFLLPPPEQVEQQSIGSGFLIDASGYIVTNAHVLAQAVQQTIILADGTRLQAEAVARDPERDLAILKVSGPAPLPFLTLGRSNDLMIGETVIVVGNPLGLQHTCTTGIISALHRKLVFSRGVTYEDLIQTDASINPGNSGGPLLNINGELIGVTSAIRGDAQNIGFAIPVDQLREMLPVYLDIERIRRVELGMHLAEELGNSASDSVRVVIARVDEGSPAAKAGLEKGDVVRAINGQATPTFMDAFGILRDVPAGKPLEVTVGRGGKIETKSVKMIAITKSYASKLLAERFGIEVREMTAEEIRALRVARPLGLVVTRVDARSEAAENGLSPGDFINRIGQASVLSLDALGHALTRVKPRQRVAVGVLRIEDGGQGVLQGDMLLTAK